MGVAVGVRVGVTVGVRVRVAVGVLVGVPADAVGVRVGVAVGVPADAVGVRVGVAVGNACGTNPYPIVVPCHRVVAANRGLGGFARNRGGFLLEVKRWLLEHERAR